VVGRLRSDKLSGDFSLICPFGYNRTSEHAAGKCHVADRTQLRAVDGEQWRHGTWRRRLGASPDGTRGSVLGFQAARRQRGPYASDGDRRPLPGGGGTGRDHRLFSAAERCHGKSPRNCPSFQVSCSWSVYRRIEVHSGRQVH